MKESEATISGRLARVFIAGSDKELLSKTVAGSNNPQIAAVAVEWQRDGSGRLECTLPIPAAIAVDVLEITPSFSSLAPADYAFCFRLEAQAGEVEGKVSLPAVGAAAIEDLGPEGDQSLARSDIDTLVVQKPLDSLMLRLSVSSSQAALLDHPWLLAAACRLRPLRASAVPAALGRLSLPIPCKSQMDVPGIGKRICSPASVAMISEYFGCPVPTEVVARRAYCPASDMYGVWPWNIYAASRFGIPGFLACFDSWAQAQALLERGLPLVASIRYGRGELSGAAQEREDEKALGHLVVIRGYDAGKVLVNDPAGKTVHDVERAYDLREFLNVWVGRSGMGYVFLPPDRSVAGR